MHIIICKLNEHNIDLVVPNRAAHSLTVASVDIQTRTVPKVGLTENEYKYRNKHKKYPVDAPEHLLGLDKSCYSAFKQSVPSY